MTTELYTNEFCPFCHRAVFAAALNSQEPKIFKMPLSSHMKIAEQTGQGFGPWKEMTFEEMKEMKGKFQAETKTSAFPVVKTADGDIVYESEIVAEYFDTVAEGVLMGKDAMQRAKILKAMQLFNPIIPALFGVLGNADEAQDEAKRGKLTEELAKWAAVLDTGGDFCFGDSPTMADVHAAPFLWRLSVNIQHFQGYDIFAGQPTGDRLPKLLANSCAHPAYQKLTPLTQDEIIGTAEKGGMKKRGA